MPPLLEVRDIRKEFGGLTALNGVNLAIAAGEIRCIVGPNGCGKTTLFNVITGTFPPSGGRVICRGQDITGLKPHKISRLGIARKFQVPGVYPTLSVVENLEIPLSAGAGRRGPFALLRHRHAGDRLEPLLGRFGLAQAATRPAGMLAHGQKQWLEMAMLMATDAELLLLDEPTAGMTAPEKTATAGLIAEMRRDANVAVLVIEHDMGFVQELACPVVVMIRGAVFCEGPYAEIQANPAVREAYLGRVLP
jgi:urea ABC transporter ATP-binding protein UrtD